MLRPGSFLWLLAAFVLMLSSGCASNPGGGDDRGGGSAQRSGVEVRRWAVRGTPGQAHRVLGVFADAQAFDDPGEARRWQQGGMIAAKVSASDLPILRQQLDGIAQERIEWLGVIPEWTTVHRGPVLQTETTVMIDSGPLRIDPGGVSMLGRAWVVPSLVAPQIRLEMMPLVPVRGAERTGMLDGVALTRQTLGITLEAGEALLVFPLGAWDAIERPEVRAGPSATQIGPPSPQWPTLGDLLLVSPSAQSEVVFEQVLVFVASLPAVPQPAAPEAEATPSKAAAPEPSATDPESIETPSESAAPEAQADRPSPEPAEPAHSGDPAAEPQEPAAEPATQPAARPEQGAPAPERKP